MLCVKILMPLFWVSTKRHHDDLERVVGTPNKVHPSTLNTIPHLWYTFRLRNQITGTEIKGQSPWSQKRDLVPKAVIDLYADTQIGGPAFLPLLHSA